MSSILDQLADWAWETGLPNIPDAVRERAKLHILDALGAAIAAADAPSVKACAAEFAPAQSTQPAACELLTGGATSAIGPAALVNAMAGHLHDFDDTSFHGIVHGTAAIWPAALAATQSRGGTGADFLEAVILGSEVEYCLGEALSNDLYRKGWWASATLGIFGAAIAAGKGLGLTRPQMQMALRLAAGHAFGVRSVFGGDSKPFLLGRATQAGIDCARFARAGLGAPDGVFEAASGFVDVFNAGQCDREVIAGIGNRYRILEPGMAIKLYPVCSAAQAATEAVQQLMQQHDLRASDIRHVEMRVTELVKTQLRFSRAATVEEARFCLPFTVAAMLDRGRLGLEELCEDYVHNETVQTLMRRVEMIGDDGILAQLDNPDTAPEAGEAILHLSNGKRLSLFNPMATGMPGKEIPAEILTAKFFDCATRSRSRAEAESLHRRLLNLENLERADLLGTG